MYLVFKTQEAAVLADKRIAMNFGMGDALGDNTSRYQNEKEQVDGTWYLVLPPNVSKALTPVYTEGPVVVDSDGNEFQTGTWAYPRVESDSLDGTTGWIMSDSVTDKPIPEVV